MSLGVLFVANLFLSLNLVRLRRRTAASGSFSAQVKFPLFGDQVAELVLLAWWFRRAADDQKGNINCYRGPVHRNEGVETVLRDI